MSNPAWKSSQKWPCKRCGKVTTQKAPPDKRSKFLKRGGVRVYRRISKCEDCGGIETRYELYSADLDRLLKFRQGVEDLLKQ